MDPFAGDADSADAHVPELSSTPPSPAPSPSLSRSFASLSVPKEVELTDTGTRLKMMGKVEEGMAKYLEAISVNSAYAPAYYNIAVVYSELGRYEEALKYYTAAIHHNKFYVEAYCNVGVIYKNVGQLEAAITFYDKALAVNPNFTIAKNNMAIALTDYGTKIKTEMKTKDAIQKAIQYYQKALVYNFQYADAYYNLGVAYGEAGENDKAVVSYELAVHFNPMCCEAYNNLGVIYKDRDNLEKSIQCYSAALNVNPRFSQTLNNLGVVYTIQGKLEEAYKHVKAAINVNPQYAEAYNNLGVLYRDEGEIEKGLACYEKCLALSPLSRNAAQNRLLAMNYLANLDTDKVFQVHKSWGDSLLSQAHPISSNRYLCKKDENKVLRVGYMSADFFTHSVSYFIEAILANHSSNIQVYCYSNVVKEDGKTQKLKQYGSVWRPIHGKGTEEVVDTILEDEIDILVELTGHTAANRLDVCLRKPAPIQVTYIGYPNTTGLPTIDYRFSDGYADPLNTPQQYTEQLIRLPHSFLCYTPPAETPDVSPPPFVKNGYITFGSFNNLAKINPRVLDLWATVMKKVPQSRLVVKCKPFASGSVKAKFLRRMEARGIASSRLELHTLLGQNSDHLAAYSWMDISLDTFPYAGTTTTCESLWMGVPVVTLAGSCHAHNVGVSILSNIGLQSLITSSKEEYVAVAVSLASDKERLAEIRQNLRTNMMNSYLCDGKTFTGNLEDVYRRIWSRYCRNEEVQQHQEIIGEERGRLVTKEEEGGRHTAGIEEFGGDRMGSSSCSSSPYSSPMFVKKHKNNNNNKSKKKKKNKKSWTNNNHQEEVELFCMEQQQQEEEKENGNGNILTTTPGSGSMIEGGIRLEPRGVNTHATNVHMSDERAHSPLSSTSVEEGGVGGVSGVGGGGSKKESVLKTGRIKLQGKEARIRKKTKKQKKKSQGVMSPKGAAGSTSKSLLSALLQQVEEERDNKHNQQQHQQQQPLSPTSAKVETAMRPSSLPTSPIPIPTHSARGSGRYPTAILPPGDNADATSPSPHALKKLQQL